ncbi:MAG TPA: C39 family peptidase [Tepidisphaeraceae bacterium]|nr:C39 family peptidase [Tepidisphaeraceae bacterium]
MHARLAHFAAGAGLITVVALTSVLLLSNWNDGDGSRPAAAASTSKTFRPNTPHTVDELVLTDTAGTFGAGSMRRVALRGDVLELTDARERSWPKSGQWTSPEVTTSFGFIELIPSWNVLTPPDTGASFDVRVRDASSGAWTDWLYLGSCGRTLTPVSRKIESGIARVKIDEMLLDKPADAYQVRATLFSFSFEPTVTPTLRRVAVVYSGETRDPLLRAKLRPPAPPDRSWARDLKLPFRAQGEETHPAPLRPQICSPTSVSMVMHHFGIDRTTVENALAIYDPEYRLFGNWNRAVQHAGSLGLDAWIARYRTWDQVKREIAAGRPVIASIRFERGTFPSALYDSTAGHLLVIRGFTKEGDVIVNDPARQKGGDGAVYKAAEFARAWFDNGGVAYIIRPPHQQATAAR